MEVNDYSDNYKLGWISIFRSIRNHWIWEDPIKLKWWIDILLEVNHSGKTVNVGYDLFDCKKGQSIMSLKNWADRWNVSKDTVRNFFELLSKDNMITKENLKKTTRITVCNYDIYQSKLHDKQTQSKRKANAKQTQSDPNNNENNGNNGNNEIIYRSFKHLSISNEENQKLIDLGYSQEMIDDIYNRIENYKNNKKYSSLYLTTLNWIKKEHPEIKPKSNKPEEKVYRVMYLAGGVYHYHTQAQIDEWCERNQTKVHSKI